MDVDLDAIAKGMALAVPYIGHMRIEVTELSEGEATALLPDRPELHNHVGSQHAGALFGVAETASGAAFVGAFAARRVDFSVEVEMTDAEGLVVATATVDWNVRLKDADG